jgi:hypothetical protein
MTQHPPSRVAWSKVVFASQTEPGRRAKRQRDISPRSLRWYEERGLLRVFYNIKLYIIKKIQRLRGITRKVREKHDKSTRKDEERGGAGASDRRPFAFSSLLSSYFSRSGLACKLLKTSFPRFPRFVVRGCLTGRTISPTVYPQFPLFCRSVPSPLATTKSERVGCRLLVYCGAKCRESHCALNRPCLPVVVRT